MTDPWVQAFLSTKAPALFHSVEHSHDVWREDPFDVPEIHREARETFERLIEQVASATVESGRILLLRGEAGSGKTHLLRAFRNYVHREDRAFFGYMQMTSSAMGYDRYVLQKLVESLDQPYCPPARRATSFRILSNAMTELLPHSRMDAFHRADEPGIITELINELTDRLADRLDCADLDLDMVRALLFLQVDRPSVSIRVIKYLRTDALSDYDREVLGGMAPRRLDDDAMHLIKQLAVIIRKVLNRSLVVCLDQMEDIFNLDDARERFARVMDAVKQIGEIPGTIAVLSCLDAFYENLRGALSGSVLARVENDPAPIVLTGERSRLEIERLVGQRLSHLYDVCGAAPAEPSTRPIPQRVLDQLRGTSRDVLRTCLQYRERAQSEGRLPDRLSAADAGGTGGSTIPPGPDTTDLQQAWNDFCSASHDLPEDEASIAALLAKAIAAAGAELGATGAFEAKLVAGEPWVGVKLVKVEGSPQDLLVAVCDKSGRGGGLRNQLEAVAGQSRNATPVVVRSTAFPASPKAQANQLFGRLVAKHRARRVVLESTDLRHMVALEGFRKKHGDDPRFAVFLRDTRPLCSLSSMHELLGLDEITVQQSRPPSVQPPPMPAATEVSAGTGRGQSSGTGSVATKTLDQQVWPKAEGPILLGQTLGRAPREVTLEVERLKRHIAFLGGTGSGKTTAALLIAEELLARGIPVLLVDRKGDLCGYADPAVWDAPLGDPERDAFRARLRERVDVALFTPGNPKGRGLQVSLMPAGVSQLDGTDRELVARVAASALANILNYGRSLKDQGQEAVLYTALKLLGATEQGPVSLEGLVGYLQDRDEELLAELGTLHKYLENVTLGLEILAKNKGPLMGLGCEPLSAELLLGASPSGRARLSVVSTKFLGCLADVQFWVAALLLEIGRWFSKHPSSELQAAIMLDEADIYLPATRQPATKAPIEDLLRRARTMGLSVFLATQSPGDLDYKCRDNILTWLVGLLAQQTAMKKLEDMFAEAHTDTSSLAGQKIGQFHVLAEGRVSRVRLRRNAVKLPSQVPDDQIVALAARGARREPG